MQGLAALAAGWRNPGTAGQLLISNGSALPPTFEAAPGASGQVLTSNGAGALPTFQHVVMIQNSAAPTVDAAGEIAVDTTITDHTGLITYHDGTEALYVVAMPTANLVATDGYVVAYNATNNEFEMVAQSGLTISSLTEVDPALADDAAIADASDSGNNKKAGLDALVAMGIGVSEGRLTLTSGTPVTTSDVTAAGTIYFTPYNGNRIRIFDGTRWKVYHFSEVSLALTLTSGSNYDVFIYDNSGTLTLELSAAWTNDTTRADALTTQDGVPVKSGATTRLHLGTIRASGTNTTEDSYGGASQSGGKRYVWNRYNQVSRAIGVIDTTDTWQYTTGAWRAANGAAGNKVEWVCGDVAFLVDVDVQTSHASLTSTEPDNGRVGVGIDSTSANSAQLYQRMGSGGEAQNTNIFYCQVAKYIGYPGLGYHFAQWIEFNDDSGYTSRGDGGGTAQSGLIAKVLM